VFINITERLALKMVTTLRAGVAKWLNIILGAEGFFIISVFSDFYPFSTEKLK
jgi:hypothetical protein